MVLDPHPWARALDTLYAHSWTRLLRGVHDRRAPARHPTLATLGSDGMPQARTVVLRDADKQAGTLVFYTDVHSAKVAELTAHPLATVHVWDASAHLQLRLETAATLLTGAEAAAHWARVPDAARHAYSRTGAPGQPIADALAYTKTPDASAFAVLRLTVQAMDVLHLGSEHRRARFERADAWRGEWRVP